MVYKKGKLRGLEDFRQTKCKFSADLHKSLHKVIVYGAGSNQVVDDKTQAPVATGTQGDLTREETTESAYNNALHSTTQIYLFFNL